MTSQTTYGEQYHAGNRKFYDVAFGEVVTLSLICGKIHVTAECGTTSVRSVDDETVALPADAIID